MKSKRAWLLCAAAQVVGGAFAISSGCSSTSPAAAGPDAGADAVADLSVADAGPLLGGESDHSASIAVSSDDATVYVVNPDSDSVSFLDAHALTLKKELLLSTASPTVDANGRFEPAVSPRALALGPGGTTLYVTGQRSGHVYAIDAASMTVKADRALCSEPVGVVVSPNGAFVYVACSTDDAVVAIDATSLQQVASLSLDRRPWGLSWSTDRTQLFATHLLGPGFDILAPTSLTRTTAVPLADGPAGAKPTVPHGPCRGMYDVLQRPGANELWVPHMMLGIDTGEPTLTFLNTAFSSVSIFDGTGSALTRLTVSTAPGDGAAIADVVSGPRSIAFTPDGALALIADTGSEDVLVIDAVKRTELALIRPLPGHQAEGIAVAHDGHAYVDERNTNDVAVLTIDATATPATVTLGATTIPRITSDPMPADMRLGQHMFYSANSDELPLTTDHWISCATCHLEGRSDAVIWRFKEGPRDTPSNAGGVLHTGFLFRTAVRNKVQDYWQTINDEQGGHFNDTAAVFVSHLDALEKYVDYAIPYAVNPSNLDPAKVAAGSTLFNSTLNCRSCHVGDYFTDSGSGNATLDLTGDAGPIALHNVGTCVTTGPWPDAILNDELGDPRTACDFDVPSLRGVFETAPYYHDGSEATLEDLVAHGRHNPVTASLSPDDQAALVAYLKSI
ncbi:MAG: hypothetical protein ACHREM_14275 [Polyangiales bacterium]